MREAWLQTRNIKRSPWGGWGGDLKGRKEGVGSGRFYEREEGNSLSEKGDRNNNKKKGIDLSLNDQTLASKKVRKKGIDQTGGEEKKGYRVVSRGQNGGHRLVLRQRGQRRKEKTGSVGSVRVLSLWTKRKGGRGNTYDDNLVVEALTSR